MIYLFTGLPGAGKTLNAIKYVFEESLFKDRPVYVYGVTGLNVTDWNELTEEQARRWDQLPDGSVILIDEVQRLWRVRTASKDIPLDVQALETHRHRGMDFIVTCQNPMQLDVGVRRLVGKHYHLDRSFSANGARRFTFERCIDDPHSSKHEASSIDRISLDKKYFDKYHSAEVHTHNLRLPFKFYMYGAFFLGFIAFLIWIFTSGLSITQDKQTLPTDIKPQQSTHEDIRIATVQNYMDMHVPRIKSLPFTAPFYDDHIEIKSIPKVSGCMSLQSEDEDFCVCNTQQGTIIDMDLQICKYYVSHGSFDFGLSDDDLRKQYAHNNNAGTITGTKTDQNPF